MIVAAVLAGGGGRRIGGRKSERLLLGRPLLRWAVGSAMRQAGKVAIAARGEAPAFQGESVVVLFDNPALAGPLSGLQAALSWAAAENASWLLTLPCDTPFAPDDLTPRLLEAATVAEAPVALASSGGALHPACGLWRTDLGVALADYAASGRSSLIGFAESVGYAVADWSMAPCDPFFNINTAEDLAKAEGFARAQHLRAPS
jgi:molybdopterin-guanine dinucleotide biosynthesis protein A